jgi:hypothetical protein
MKLEQLLMPTRVAQAGMTVRDFFTECSGLCIPGLPFCTKSGRIKGRVTLKNILKTSFLPDYIVDSAMILGDELECTKEVEAQARQLLSMPVDPYVQEPHLSLSSDAAALKALALMEQNDTSYMFIVDEWQYRGVVTIQSLARAMFQLDQ